MGSNDGSISFGKGRKVDFQGFNGIRKDDFNVEGNEKKKKLVEAIFNHYNVDGANGDIVLDRSELARLQQDVTNYASGGKKGQLGKGEAAKFLQSLGLSKDEYTREELLEILAEINVDEDSVEEAHPNQDGSTSVQYKPDSAGNTKVEVYNAKHVLNYGLVVNDDTETLTEYAADGKTKVAVIEEDKKKHTVLNTKYADDGITVTERYRQVSPAIREDLDPANGDRVVKRTTALGNNLSQTQEYEYNNDIVTELLTNPDGTKVKTTTDGTGMKNILYIDSDGHETKQEAFNGEKKIWTTTYTYDANGRTINTEHYSADDGSVTSRTRETLDNNDNILTHVNVDADGKIQDYVHTVDPARDTWYGIVQAKYGITDHKTTMAIVHQLKANHNVSRSANTIPSKLTLPGTVKVGDTEYNLININRQVNDIHNIPQQIAKPANIPAYQLPQKIEPLTAAEKKVTIPPLSATKPADIPQADLPQNGGIFPEGKPKKIDMAQYTFPVVKENAGKLVKQDNGQFFQYDSIGRVISVYADEASANYDNYITSINYVGNEIDYLIKCDYDDAGHNISDIRYNSRGNAIQYNIATKLDDNRFRRVAYDMSANVLHSFIDEYNSSNQKVKTIKYNTLGSAENMWEYSYNDNILNKELFYTFNSDGTEVKSYDTLEDIRLWNHSTYTEYNTNGKPTYHSKSSYDEAGNWTGKINYDKNGNATDYVRNLEFDENGNHIYQVNYDLNGNVEWIFKDYERKPDGNLLRYNRYTPQGKYDYHWEYRYSDDGRTTKTIEYNDQGRRIGS